jgi:signal transduction histidine kinase
VQAQPGLWRISVHDTGTGMTADQLQHLFEPFNRQGRPTAPAPDSVGLGLALMQSLVRGMGGQLTAQSTPGQGSQFDVSLPAA